MNSESEELGKRLEKMEEQIRWLKKTGTAAVILAGISIGVIAALSLVRATPVQSVSPQSYPQEIDCKVIKTERLVLRDENGKLRALLGSTGEHAGFFLYGKEENSIAELRASNDGAGGFFLYGKEGKARAVMMVIKDEPILDFYDGNDKRRARLWVGKDAPHLEMLDMNEKKRAILGHSNETGPVLIFCDPTEKPTKFYSDK